MINHNNILIYKEPGTKTYYYSHCYGSERFFVELEGGHSIEGTHPATKEQRETLFKSMTKAGYTFDFNKKELKEVEQKSTWSKEDEIVCSSIISDLEAQRGMFKDELGKSICDYRINWLKGLKTRIEGISYDTTRKLTKLKQIADAMYYSMQNLTTDTTNIREAMNNYRQFVINELKED